MLFHSIAPGGSPAPPHVIITNLDHQSVALTAQHFKKLNFIGSTKPHCLYLCLDVKYYHSDLTVVEADPSSGQVRPEDIVSSLRPSTKLVSLVLANNETGVIQPVMEVVRVIREWEGREKRGRTVFIHTDAAQVG